MNDIDNEENASKIRIVPQTLIKSNDLKQKY